MKQNFKPFYNLLTHWIIGNSCFFIVYLIKMQIGMHQRASTCLYFVYLQECLCSGGVGSGSIVGALLVSAVANGNLRLGQRCAPLMRHVVVEYLQQFTLP